jgi:uncharacterized surface protein with fasciclin (FAS1) repeats
MESKGNFMEDSNKDIIDTAVAAGNFTTLSNAWKAAGLVDTLKSEGPFTVFAPTDAAFKKLPAGTLHGLLKDKTKLAGILSYHLVSGKVMASDIKSGGSKTAHGNMLEITLSATGVMVDGAKMTKADIETSNGVIHSIDTVVMPK